MSNYKKHNNQRSKTDSGRKSNRVPASKKKRPTLDKFDADSATNNPSWYTSEPNLVRDSASIPFSWPVGAPINLENPALDVLPIGQTFSIPGVCAFRVIPAIGRADNPSDPINVASFRLYSFIRHANSGSKNYDAPDLMLYLLSMSQVYSYINYLQRIYGVVNLYSQKNRYLPQAILTAMNADYDDLRNNLAGFRYGIDVLIKKVASFCVPASMTIFQRHSSMFQNIYIEGQSIKDQIYFYTPAGFWWFNLESRSATGEEPSYAGMLEYHGFTIEDKFTGDQLLDYGHRMIDRLLQSDDMVTMSGDIEKAYGQANLIKLASMPMDYMILPLTDLAVLQQMKNSTPLPVNTTTLDVKQSPNKGWLLFQPVSSITLTEDTWLNRATTKLWQTFLEKRVLSSPSPEPSPEEIMESTRDTVICKDFMRSEDGLTASCSIVPGSDFIGGVIYYYYDYPDNGTTPFLRTHIHGYLNTINADDSNNVLLLARCAHIESNFKFRPAKRNILCREGSTPGTFNISTAYLDFDVENYTVIDATILGRLHETAMLSLLSVPTINKV